MLAPSLPSYIYIERERDTASTAKLSYRLHCQFPQGEKKVGSEAMNKKSITVGPWGGNGGNNWDDGSFSGVREIKLVYERCIDSISVEYDMNGEPVLAEKHGGVGGGKTANIKLQHPEEFLTRVSGHYSPVVRGGTPVIRSLTFKSNKRSFGPYGIETGRPFTFPRDGEFVVIGFRGSSGWYLDKIGFHLSKRQSSFLDKARMKIQKCLGRKNVDDEKVPNDDGENTNNGD